MPHEKSTFHRHFKAVTALSLLQHPRRLMKTCH